MARVKRKGAYEYDLEWHQNHSALVVPKVAEKVLLEGAPIRETVERWPDIMDFMLRVKVPRSSSLVIEYRDICRSDGRCQYAIDNGAEGYGHCPTGKCVMPEQQHPLQNTTRYLITKSGGHLFKQMPPLKGKELWRQIGVEAGWKVTPCNDVSEARGARVDYDYYVNEVEKLVNGLS